MVASAEDLTWKLSVVAQPFPKVPLLEVIPVGVVSGKQKRNELLQIETILIIVQHTFTVANPMIFMMRVLGILDPVSESNPCCFLAAGVGDDPCGVSGQWQDRNDPIGSQWLLEPSRQHAGLSMPQPGAFYQPSYHQPGSRTERSSIHCLSGFHRKYRSLERRVGTQLYSIPRLQKRHKTHIANFQEEIFSLRTSGRRDLSFYVFDHLVTTISWIHQVNTNRIELSHC